MMRDRHADRLTLSILPPPVDQKQTMRHWAANLRDYDERWQKLSQDGVQFFMGWIMDQRMPFAFGPTRDRRKVP